MQRLDTQQLDQVVGGATAIELIDLCERFIREQQLWQGLREPFASATAAQ
jgi:hypothetical protein